MTQKLENQTDLYNPVELYELYFDRYIKHKIILRQLKNDIMTALYPKTMQAKHICYNNNH